MAGAWAPGSAGMDPFSLTLLWPQAKQLPGCERQGGNAMLHKVTVLQHEWASRCSVCPSRHCHLPAVPLSQKGAGN